MYDYNNARFLSVDPFIQAPTSTQSLNPYTYIFNNPLSGIDPTGYCSTTDDRSECGSALKEGESEDITNENGEAVGTVTAGKDGSRSFTTATGKIGAKVNNAALSSGIAGDGVVLLKKDQATSDIGGEQSKSSQFVAGVKEFVSSSEHIKGTFKKTFDFAVSEGNQEAAKNGALLAIPIPVGWLVKISGPAVKSLGKPFANWLKALGASSKGVLDGANFAQKTFSKTFSSTGKFAGKTIDDVAASLKSGVLKVTDVPIDYIVRNGNTLILNTRSSQALIRAQIPRSQWKAVNRSGNKAFESRLSDQLARNKLTEAGTSTVRQSKGIN